MGAVKDFLMDVISAADGGDRAAIRFLIDNNICPYCKEFGFSYRWRTSGHSRQIEVRCGHCQRFIKWAPQTSSNIAAAQTSQL